MSLSWKKSSMKFVNDMKKSIFNTLILTEITNVKAHLNCWTLKASASGPSAARSTVQGGTSLMNRRNEGPCYLAGMSMKRSSTWNLTASMYYIIYDIDIIYIYRVEQKYKNKTYYA